MFLIDRLHLIDELERIRQAPDCETAAVWSTQLNLQNDIYGFR